MPTAIGCDAVNEKSACPVATPFVLVYGVKLWSSSSIGRRLILGGTEDLDGRGLDEDQIAAEIEELERENGTTSIVPTRENAGLRVEVDVSRIDDNGFVSMSINPEISVAIPTGDSSGGYSIFNIQARTMDSGQIRLRDGQSLVLTGVITDSDRAVAQKWPILGDLPLIGQLFRSTASSREKNELVIIVTPRILDDEQGGAYGYGYRPATAASREMMRSQY